MPPFLSENSDGVPVIGLLIVDPNCELVAVDRLGIEGGG